MNKHIEELKKAASTIGYEKWITDGAGEVATADYIGEHGVITGDHICNCEVVNGESENATFISLANPARILDLIAQLEATQKELFDFHNQEFQQRLANAEHQLYMKDLAIHNIKASRKAQFRKRLAAEAELSAANERSIACVNAFEGIETERFAGKSIGEFLAGEVRLNKAEPKPDGSFGFTFSGLAIQIMAESFADQFKSSGAVNYLELLFEHSEIGPLTVTMQRVDGLTPAQKLAAAEERAEAAEAELSAANEMVPVTIDSGVIRDANRYRFLRDEDSWGEDSDSWDVETRTGLISSENLMELRLDHFDAAIDARIAASDIPFLNPVTSVLSAEDSKWKQRAEAAEARLLVPVKLPDGYVVRAGHPINEGERNVLIPKRGGNWLSRFDVEHAIRAGGYPVERGE